ncbi:hypothetical protein WJX73_001377 [Symbiochloris irregularis]|uniref:Uncharacterized protein n=1 Tax=Symbiochloris irregularis TaxID=706552 RepID=A0AAW1NMG5_9CHLO
MSEPPERLHSDVDEDDTPGTERSQTVRQAADEAMEVETPHLAAQPPASQRPDFNSTHSTRGVLDENVPDCEYSAGLCSQPPRKSRRSQSPSVYASKDHRNAPCTSAAGISRKPEQWDKAQGCQLCSK